VSVFAREEGRLGSGAEAGRSTSQEETNPAGHGGRGRGGYAQEARRASEGDIGASERRARCEIAALGIERAGKELRASVLSRGIGATC
jgi:hypothetical protein